MKVNLLLDSNDIRSGYLNLDAVGNNQDKKRADLTNLDQYVDDAECEDLIAINVIEYFPANEVDKILRNWLKKLRHGGTITIGHTDFVQVCKAISNRIISLENAQILLHGDQSKPWRVKKCNFSVDQMANALQSVGLKILKKRVNNLQSIVIAQRQ